MPGGPQQKGRVSSVFVSIDRLAELGVSRSRDSRTGLGLVGFRVHCVVISSRAEGPLRLRR